MKKNLLLFSIIFSFIIYNFGFNIISTQAEQQRVYLGGMPAGFKIDNVGATVIGVNDVISKNGIFSPSREAEIKAGDVIISLDGNKVNSAFDVENILYSYDGNGITATIEREGEILIKIIYPVKDLMDKYRMGVFIRDDICGIGTITYIKNDKSFGALGHPIVDGSSQKIVKINSGKIYACNIIGVNKGVRGKAGEIRGYFIEDDLYGDVKSNTNKGIFGKITSDKLIENLPIIEIGSAKPGNAEIYSTISGCHPKKYDINIVKYDEKAPENKNLVIKITDKSLIEQTGGILQGMSGSPIVQDGKLVGAITHVFINDPERGFGISIENMMNE